MIGEAGGGAFLIVISAVMILMIYVEILAGVIVMILVYVLAMTL